ncbi:hypothetical protein [Pararhizobium sp. IMCC21322]|uniref:hypothetical protein n=1 Tax=Pararhizobium sp. IMCC21322 TaxID=3067903 RepID=UPI0027404E09|nr:hypothetical protein [Pararhizobium sp. IMCC21322]
MIREFLDDIAFAMSGKPMDRRRLKLKQQVLEADRNRAKGVISSLSRGSVLLQLEEVGDGGSELK